MQPPVNLYFRADGRVAVRYWLQGGTVRERVADFPAALLAAPPDPEAAVAGGVFARPEEVLFAAFRALPLNPRAPWCLARGTAFSALYRRTFAALLRMLRKAPKSRWCVRGEPESFLQFGLREPDGSYTLGAFVLPCGRPAVLTFRVGDLIERLPPKAPFACMRVSSAADGLPEQVDGGLAWDTRVRLPIADRGAALLRVWPEG